MDGLEGSAEAFGPLGGGLADISANDAMGSATQMAPGDMNVGSRPDWVSDSLIISM